MEDYEQKYKEALEWARKVMQGKVGFVLDEVLEKFPELKESEDERIRKALIFAVRDYDYVNSIPSKDVIAWLEKQGEKAKYHDICDKCVRQPTCQSDCFLQQGEQKPAWSEEDKQYLLVCKNALAKYQKTDHWDAMIISSWLEDKVRQAISQPKQEWSEEDDKALKSIINDISQGAIPDEEDTNWLKSLNPRSHWKPSDEQIDALKRAIAKERENPDTKQFARHLESLFNELMRL